MNKTKKRRSKTYKKKIKCKRKNKMTKKRGGNGKIYLRQILITDPIIDAVKEKNPSIDTTEFKKSKGVPGFRVSRMDNMMSLDFDELLSREPVELKPAKNSAGQPMGITIDGKKYPLYEIMNGRHRIARSIIEGREKINATIVGS
jgi:hypothetical protein